MYIKQHVIHLRLVVHSASPTGIESRLLDHVGDEAPDGLGDVGIKV